MKTIHRLCYIMLKNIKISQTTINRTKRKQKTVTSERQPRKLWRMRFHNMEQSSHRYTTLCTLEICVSVAIRQHKLSFFLLCVVSSGLLLFISAKLSGVHRREGIFSVINDIPSVDNLHSLSVARKRLCGI